MDTGLILEEYYGMASKIYTSIDYWNIFGSSSSQKNGFIEIINELKNKLDLKLIKDGNQTDYSPLWEIRKINGIIIPLSKKEKSKYIEYSECKNIWSKFKFIII